MGHTWSKCVGNLLQAQRIVIGWDGMCWPFAPNEMNRDGMGWDAHRERLEVGPHWNLHHSALSIPQTSHQKVPVIGHSFEASTSAPPSATRLQRGTSRNGSSMECQLEHRQCQHEVRGSHLTAHTAALSQSVLTSCKQRHWLACMYANSPERGNHAVTNMRLNTDQHRTVSPYGANSVGRREGERLTSTTHVTSRPQCKAPTQRLFANETQHKSGKHGRAVPKWQTVLLIQRSNTWHAENEYGRSHHLDGALEA